MVNVRYGKGSKGSGPRRRMVASVMPWAVESLQDYLVNGPDHGPAAANRLRRGHEHHAT